MADRESEELLKGELLSTTLINQKKDTFKASQVVRWRAAHSVFKTVADMEVGNRAYRDVFTACFESTVCG